MLARLWCNDQGWQCLDERSKETSQGKLAGRNIDRKIAYGSGKMTARGKLIVQGKKMKGGKEKGERRKLQQK